MKVNLITSELIVQARAALQRFIEGKGRLCIPAQPTDDDMLLSEALDRLQVLSDPGHALVAVAPTGAVWHPAKEKPAEEGRYLTITREDDGFNFYRIRAWSSDWSESPVWEGPGCEEVLYWMPLPPAPEGMEWK